MSFEILYTSAPEGLRKGSQGYCTVVSTRGIPKTLAERLEIRGGYPHPFSPGDPKNPVNYSHLLLTVGGIPYHLLSRVADCGYDYSQRSNKLAHHVALAAKELTSGGPAWVLAEEGFCETEWNGKVHLLESGRTARSDSCEGGVCHAWKQLCGDPGWAGVLAENAMSPQQKTACVVFKPGQDVLPLVVEAMSLLPPKVRWRTTFSTYYTKLQAVESIRWCFVLDGSPEADSARRDPRVTLIDLCDPTRRAPDDPYVDFARTGKMSLPPESKVPTKVVDRGEQPQLPKERERINTAGGSAKPPELPPLIVEGGGISGGFSGVSGVWPDVRVLPKRRKSQLYWLAPTAVAVVVLVGILLWSLFGVSNPPKVAKSEEDTISQNEGKQKAVEKNRIEETSPEVTSTQESDRNQDKKDESVTKGKETLSNDGSAKESTTGFSVNRYPKTAPPKIPPSVPPKKTRTFKEQLPDPLDIPESARSMPKSKGFGKLDLEYPEKLELKLLGSNSLAMAEPEYKEKFTIGKVDSSEPPYIFNVWHEYVPNKGITGNPVKSKLGYFELQSDQLSFYPKYDDNSKERYEVFCCHLLRFSYPGKASHTCRLREASRGQLDLVGDSNDKKGWMIWTFQTGLKRKKPFKLCDPENPLKSNLPKRESLKLDVLIKDYEEGSAEEKMTFRLGDPSPKATSSKGDIKFEAALVSAQDFSQLQLRLKASLKLKRINFPGKKLDLRDKTKVEREIPFIICEDSIAEVKLDCKNIQAKLDEAEKINRNGLPPEKRKQLEDNEANANDAINSATAWLKKARTFQNDFPQRLRREKAEIEATLYATPNNKRVPIIVFSTKEEKQSVGSGRL